MAASVVKWLRQYLAPALLTYTVLVTFLLVLTAWNDVTPSVRGDARRHGGAAHRYVPSAEELRRLPVAEDVDGDRGLFVNRRSGSLNSYGRGRYPAIQNGRKVQSSLSNDFYVDEMDNSTNDNGNGSLADDILPPGGRDYIMESRLYKSHSDSRLKMEGGGQEEGKFDGSHRNDQQSLNVDIEIEEMIPSTGNESSQNSDSKNSNNNIRKEVPHFQHHSFVEKKSADGGSNHSGGSAKAGKDRPEIKSSEFPDMQFCDNVENDGKLCYRDRVVYSHRRHVNISSTHQSFRGFAGLHIYSAFLDTRQIPATVRLMTIGPKGFIDGGSGLWCAFSSSLSVSRRYRWTGQDDSVATGRTQASQLYFHAASDGHGKGKQFYVMSCDVPKGFVKTLARLEGNRMDIIAGTQESALLDTIQERTTVTVINNNGLPLHVLREQFLDMQKKRANSFNNEGYLHNKISGQHQNRTVVPNGNVDSNGLVKGSLTVQNVGVAGRGDSLLSETSTISSEALASDNDIAFVRPSEGHDTIVSCVAPIFSLTGIVQITEFIELTLLLGVQHIVFYTNRLSTDVRQILTMYINQGLVTVLPWNIPDSEEIWAKGRDVALNDCLYRTMFLYDFVLFHDMDEFLVPRATPDLPSLLGFLRTKGKVNTTRISDIVFNSAYFPKPTKSQFTNLTNMAGYTKDVSKFLSLRSLHRTYFSSQHTLRIIQPIAAMRVGAGERKRTTFYINPRFAAVNHYAKCPSASTPADHSAQRDKHNSVQSGQNSVDCVHTKWDDVIWKYKDKLIDNTKDSIRAFNEVGKRRVQKPRRG